MEFIVFTKQGPRRMKLSVSQVMMLEDRGQRMLPIRVPGEFID